jgi:hypothetical protein
MFSCAFLQLCPFIVDRENEKERRVCAAQDHMNALFKRMLDILEKRKILSTAILLL